MCELTIELKAPHNITLLIDGQCYPAQKIGEYKIILEPETQHKLEIRVAKLDFKKENYFEKFLSIFLKNKYYDEFYNLVYKADFRLPSNSKSAKIAFEYKKFKTHNFEKREIMVPYLQITKKSKIEIFNQEKSVFNSKKDFIKYYLRHRWLQLFVFLFIFVLLMFYITDTFIEYQNNLYKPFEDYRPGRLAPTPIIDIILTGILTLVWIICSFVANYLFLKRCLKFSNGSTDDKYGEKDRYFW